MSQLIPVVTPFPAPEREVERRLRSAIADLVVAVMAAPTAEGQSELAEVVELIVCITEQLATLMRRLPGQPCAGADEPYSEVNLRGAKAIRDAAVRLDDASRRLAAGRTLYFPLRPGSTGVSLPPPGPVDGISGGGGGSGRGGSGEGRPG